MAEKYFIEWTANTGESCRLSLQDSLWAYSATELKGFSRSPVVREHQTDGEDVLGVFRASRLTVQIVDEGGTGIEEFSTGNATRWKAVLTVGGVTKFEGFYVPDDLSQQVIFNPNQLTLTFTDGLGLLKNFTISDTDLDTTADKYTILEIINACLRKTGLNLPLRVFGNIYANGLMTQRYTSNTADPFFQARQKLKSYLTQNAQDDDSWQNCYDVIESILRDWNATIYQEDGYWYIVRVPELSTGSPDGTEYDENLYNPLAITDDLQDFVIGAGETIKPVNRSQIKTLVRPAKKIVNTYNYQVVRLLLNANLTNLGALQGTSVSGDNTIERYALLNWENKGGCDGEIYIVRDTITEKELERYIKFTFSSTDTNCIYSNEFDVNEGDKFEFSFELRAESDSNFNSRQGFGVWLKGVSNTEYILYEDRFKPGSREWILPGDAQPVNTGTYASPKKTVSLNRPGTDDLREPFTIQIAQINIQAVDRIPEDGKCRIAVFGFNPGGSRVADRDSLIAGMRFEYYLYVNKSIRVKGEVHTAELATDLNNNFERDIKTADSPKSNIAGTLFVGDTKTESWGADDYPFAKLSILDEMLLRGVARYKLEGDFRGLLSMNKVLAPDFFTGRRFFCNRLVVDYGTGVCSLFADEISGPDDITYGDIDYSFKFNYE